MIYVALVIFVFCTALFFGAFNFSFYDFKFEFDADDVGLNTFKLFSSLVLGVFATLIVVVAWPMFLVFGALVVVVAGIAYAIKKLSNKKA